MGFRVWEFEIGRGGLGELAIMFVGEFDSSTSAAADEEEEEDGKEGKDDEGE
jgi:hypothetical protein